MEPRAVRIFIPSPSDVAEERRKAQQVVAEFARHYAGRLALKLILWEDLPLMSALGKTSHAPNFVAVAHCGPSSFSPST